MMKKVFILVCTVVLLLTSITGCTADPKKVLVGAVAKTQALDSAEIEMDLKLDTVLGGMTMEMPATGTVKYVKTGEEYQVQNTMSMELMGQKADTASYYEKGTLYVTSGSDKTKRAITAEEVLEQIPSMMALTDDMIKTVTTEKAENGTKYVLSLDEAKLSEYLKSVMNQTGTGLESMAKEFHFSDIEIYYILDAKDYVAQQFVSFSTNLSLDGGEMGKMEANMKMEMGLQFVNPGQAVSVTAPADLDTYKEDAPVV